MYATRMQQLLRRKIIPLFHRIRPPNATQAAPKTRLFTSHQPLLLGARMSPRPQLPFLWAPFANRGGQSSARLSTAAKANIKYQLQLGLYWAVTGYVLLFGGIGLYFIIRHDWLERQFPTPDDWNYYIRAIYHEARQEDLSDGFDTGVVDWARVGTRYLSCLNMCETWKKASKDLKEQEEGGIDIPGAGRAGLDISAKSEPWRRGYYEILMGCAKAAEQLEGWVKDRTRNIAFRASEVVGPSNPYPKPVPKGSNSAPLEENCDPAFDPPEKYYMKIITTKGFTNKQRMDAGLAYASWLDFKGLHETAMEMYKWSLDIACSAVDNPASVVNRQTGVIQPNTANVSSNVLAASTALASHFARTDNIAAALNVYLSVLRARRAADTLPPSLDRGTQDTDLSLGTFDSVLRYIMSVSWTIDYPPEPPSGDEPFRRSRSQHCEEAAIMAYVGEILFASRAERDGLSWTRDAVAMADAGVEDTRLSKPEKNTCMQCLETGLTNWQKMVRRLAQEDEESGLLPSKVKSVLKGGAKSEQKSVWRQEERMVNERLEQFYDKRLDERLRAGVISAGRLMLL